MNVAAPLSSPTCSSDRFTMRTLAVSLISPPAMISISCVWLGSTEARKPRKSKRSSAAFESWSSVIDEVSRL